MLYLEDYLEMIEHLPQELRDRFTEMRELDLAVQNNMDSLDKKSRLFFQQCKRGELQHDSMDAEFHSLRGDYFKVMEDADEKVAIATQIHELVERYLRRLDSELFKFKCELEADNNGITEILEKRSLELDGNNSTAATALLLSINQKENRYYNTTAASNNNLIASNMNSSAGIITSTGNTTSSLLVNTTALSNLSSNNTAAGGHQRHRKLEKRRETICTVPVQEKRANLNQSLPVAPTNSVNSIVNPVQSNHVTTLPTHATLPVAPANPTNTVAANIVRQLPTNLTAHNVLSTTNNSAAVAAAAAAAAAAASNNVNVGTVAGTGTGGISATHGNTTVSYNLHQLGGGAAASSAIAAAASQAIVATQQMPQGRRTASLKASYEAIHGAGVAGSTEFWSAAAAHNNSIQPATGTLATTVHHHQPPQQQQQQQQPQPQQQQQQQQQQPQQQQQQQQHQHQHHHHHQHQHHQHHHEKKHKKKLNASISVPAGIAYKFWDGASSGNSIASSSSSMSVDSVDMLANVSTTPIPHASLNQGTLAINTPTNPLPTNHSTTPVATTTAAVPLPTVNNVTATAIGLPSTTIAPGANLTISEAGLVVEQTNEGEWSYDPNEPRYCTCNQVSYGDMVACDNVSCPYEWFHYPCVGITQPPKGKWYCPKCTASMRRRGNRKN